jgi:thymidylate kinase
MPESYRVIDADRSIELVHADIWHHVEQLLEIAEARA